MSNNICLYLYLMININISSITFNPDLPQVMWSGEASKIILTTSFSKILEINLDFCYTMISHVCLYQQR